MSFEAMAAVMDADIRPPSLKLVAVAMANFLNHLTGQLNPSIGAIAKACGLSEVQTRRLVHELIDMKVLSVVGNQKGGSTGISRHYRLNLDQLIGTPLTGESPTPLTGERSVTFGTHASHERASPLSPAIAPPLTGETQIREEARKKRNLNREANDRAIFSTRPADVSQQHWADWMEHCRMKKILVTAAVLGSARRESEKAGIPLEEFLETWCFLGSRVLKAEWLQPRNGCTPR